MFWDILSSTKCQPKHKSFDYSGNKNKQKCWNYTPFSCDIANSRIKYIYENDKKKYWKKIHSEILSIFSKCFGNSRFPGTFIKFPSGIAEVIGKFFHNETHNSSSVHPSRRISSSVQFLWKIFHNFPCAGIWDFLGENFSNFSFI